MSEPEKPVNKGGRPKGSKSRPKWLLDELKKAPPRPRGRPKGSKNKPKTLEELLQHSPAPPAPRKAASAKPRPARTTENYFSRLKREDPEKLAAISREAANSAARAARPRTPPGKPPQVKTNHEWALHKDEARKIAHKVFKMMDKEGALPENPIAREAMKNALEMLAEDNSAKDRLAVIRTLLEWNLAKPASTQNVNVKTAEDFLDELAAEDPPAE
jgi:hypothetical protein